MVNTHGIYAAPKHAQVLAAFNQLEQRQVSRRRRGLDGSIMSRLCWRIRENKLRSALHSF